MYHTLLESTQTDFYDFFLHFQELDKIQKEVGTTVYNRGKSYTNNVLNLQAVSSKNIIAKVEGTRNYKIELVLSDKHVEAKCSCPYFEDSGTCKHIVAVFLVCKNEPSRIKLDSKKSESKISVNQQKTPKITINDSKKVFSKVKTEIDRIFANKELRYNPRRLEKKLVESLSELTLIWETDERAKIKSFFWEMMEQVNNASEKGYLLGYNPYNGEEHYFEGKHLTKYITACVSKLPAQEKIKWIKEFRDISKKWEDELINIDGNLDKIYTPKDLPIVKKECLETLKTDFLGNAEVYFDLLADHMSLQERLFFLEKTYKQSINLLEKFIILIKENELRVIKICHECIMEERSRFRSRNFLENHILMLINHKENSKIKEIVQKITERNLLDSVEALEKWRTLLPDYADKFEQVFRNLNPKKYFIYCSKHKRFDVWK